MQNLEIKFLDVKEIDNAELVTIDGGYWWVLWGAAAAAGTQILADWDDFKAGLSGECPPK